jgi:hypothetical protein
MADLRPPPIRLIVLRHPFSQSREVVEAPFGQTLEALAADQDLADAHALALVGGVAVPRAAWKWLKPKPGVEVILRRVPEKGGKSGLGALLSIASFFVPAFGPTISILGQSFSVGQMLVKGALFLASSALSRPQSQRLGSTGARDAPTFQLTGTSNKAAPYGPVPRLYGCHRIYPPIAAVPYTETIGGKHYLNMLFDFGYGPLLFDDFRIGATPLANFTGVEMEVRPGYENDAPITLYRNDVSAQALAILIEQADGARVIETGLGADEATLNFVFQQGLVTFDPESGGRLNRTVRIHVDYRLAGSGGPWLYEGVQGTVVPTASTAATLIASTATSKTYRTDEKTTGAVQLSVDMVEGDELRISTRSYGDTVWVQQSVQVCAGGAMVVTYVTNGEQLIPVEEWVTDEGTRSVSLIVAPSVQSEILIEQVTPAAAPVVNGFSYSYPSSGYYDFRARKVSPYLTSARIIFPTRGKYEIRVQRITADTESSSVLDDITWSGLNSVTYASPTNVTGHALIALRIEATEQLSGVVQEFSAICTALLKTWDGAAWTDWVETRNPAWAYADILSGTANARPIDRARLDADALKAWADDCAAGGIEFNGVFDFRTTVFEAARDVAAVGRASFHMRDGLYSIVQDKAQTVPVQHFTPRNSWGYSGSRRFVELPHALKCRFLNRDKDWQQDERMVCDDGYTEETATRFEVIELFGVDNADQAWKDGRRYIANARLRPEEHSFFADVEHIVCNRGDLIRVSHDVPLFGLGYGRLKAVTLNGTSEATAATLDAAIVMETGQAYSLRIRRANGASVVAGIDVVVGEQTAVTFTTPIPAASAPAAGDLFMFGKTGAESVELLVTAIEPRADLSAQIKCVDAAPAVYQADAGTIPPWTSQISLPAVWERRPARPILEEPASDESVLILTPDGGYQAVMQIEVSIPGGSVVPAVSLEITWRAEDDDAWQVMSLPPVSPQTVTIADVQAGIAYQVRARTLGGDGSASLYTEIAHTVIGASTAPPAVTNLLIRNGGLVWDHAPPRDHAGYRVRYRFDMSRHWDSAAPAHIGLVTDTPFPVDSILAAGGTAVFLVRAEDLAGNLSEEPATLIVNLGDAVTDNVILTHNLHTAFPGTVVDGAVDAGKLKADDTAAFWGPAGSPFWGLPDAAFWDTQFAQMTYTFSVAPSVEESGPGRVLLAHDLTGNGFAIDFKMAGSEEAFWGAPDEPFWGAAADPFWALPPDWTAWPGELTPIPAAGIDFRIVMAGGSQRGIIHTLSVLLDVPDVIEHLDDVAIDSAGTRLPLAAAYRAIQNVGLTLQDAGTGARSIFIIDKDADLGPLVQARDGSGTPVDALIDATIQGY